MANDAPAGVLVVSSGEGGVAADDGAEGASPQCHSGSLSISLLLGFLGWVSVVRFFFLHLGGLRRGRREENESGVTSLLSFTQGLFGRALPDSGFITVDHCSSL